MAEGFKRIESSDVTECLMAAVEHADEMQTVVVLYLAKDGIEDEGGYFTACGTTNETLLWLLETIKFAMLNSIFRKD